jgi:hypothetical protein
MKRFKDDCLKILVNDFGNEMFNVKMYENVQEYREV